MSEESESWVSVPDSSYVIMAYGAIMMVVGMVFHLVTSIIDSILWGFFVACFLLTPAFVLWLAKAQEAKT